MDQARRRHLALPCLAAVVATLALAGGCVERRVWIETEPPGALVWINDRQVGRSPVGVEIVHEGVYDLRLEKEGYEPLVTPATTDGPAWDRVPLDFFAEILPVDAKSETRWRFTLSPRDDSEDALVSRAEALRESLRAQSEASRPTPAEALQSLEREVEGGGEGGGDAGEVGDAS